MVLFLLKHKIDGKEMEIKVNDDCGIIFEKKEGKLTPVFMSTDQVEVMAMHRTLASVGFETIAGLSGKTETEIRCKAATL